MPIARAVGAAEERERYRAVAGEEGNETRRDACCNLEIVLKDLQKATGALSDRSRHGSSPRRVASAFLRVQTSTRI